MRVRPKSLSQIFYLTKIGGFSPTRLTLIINIIFLAIIFA